MTPKDEYFLEQLIDSELITANQAVDVRIYMLENGGTAEQAVIQMGLVWREDILRNIAHNYVMDFMPALTHVDEDAVNLLTPGQAWRYRTLPFQRNGNSVQVAICDPLNVEALDALRHMMEKEIDAVVIPREEIDRALSRYYGAAEKAV
jgi:hypothetical protein